jgi:hypothetical protein
VPGRKGFRHHVAVLLVAQGLPYGFFTQALPVLLRDAGLSLKAISATSLLFYVAAAFGASGIAMFWAGNVAEHVLGGMATVAILTLMMDVSDPQHASTDYTLFARAVVFARGSRASRERRGPSRLQPAWQAG